jgi:hypothetical protein
MTVGKQLWVPGNKGSILKPGLIRSVRNNDISYLRHQKPRGGLWTSSLVGGTSAWIEWCKSEEEGWLRTPIWEATPTSDVRVREIDSYGDLEKLATTYGWTSPSPYSGREEWYLDWVAVGKDYDAIHLTEKGEGETRISGPLTLYGWDCETVFWYRWKFEEVKIWEPTDQSSQMTI